jgi:hypothetical protein
MSRSIRVSLARCSPGQNQIAMAVQAPHVTTGTGCKPFRLTGLCASGLNLTRDFQVCEGSPSISKNLTAYYRNVIKHRFLLPHLRGSKGSAGVVLTRPGSEGSPRRGGRAPVSYESRDFLGNYGNCSRRRWFAPGVWSAMLLNRLDRCAKICGKEGAGRQRQG